VKLGGSKQGSTYLEIFSEGRGGQNMYIVILLNLGLDIWFKIRHIEDIFWGSRPPGPPLDTAYEPIWGGA